MALRYNAGIMRDRNGKFRQTKPDKWANTQDDVDRKMYQNIMDLLRHTTRA